MDQTVQVKRKLVWWDSLIKFLIAWNRANLHWAIPEKKTRGREGVESILFLKTPLEFFIFLLYPLKFQRKQSFTPGNSTKFC